MRAAVIIAITFVCLNSCSEEIRLVEPALDVRMFRSWLFYGFQVSGDSLITPYPGETIVLNLRNDGRLDGQTSCNSFAGSFHFDPTGTLHLDSLRHTFVGCSPSSDPEFFAALEEANALNVVDTILYLYYDGRSSRMIFTPS